MSDQDDVKRRADFRKKFLSEFDREAAKGREEQDERDAGHKLAREKDDADFRARGLTGLAEEQEHEKQRRADEAQWRKDEAERKLELERFKQRKAEEERYFKEQKEKERIFEEKKHKYFNSLHEAAAKSALAHRAEFQANQQLDKDLDSVDHAARDAKAAAEHDCLVHKEQIERDRLAERDRLDRDHRDSLIRLHGELNRKRSQLENEHHSTLAAISSLPVAQQPEKRTAEESQYRTKLSALERDMEKRRQEIEAEFLARREGANRDSMRERSQAEHALILRLNEIEAERQQKKAALIAGREKTRKKGR